MDPATLAALSATSPDDGELVSLPSQGTPSREMDLRGDWDGGGGNIFSGLAALSQELAMQQQLAVDPEQPLCKYRKGKCLAPRTRKRNGSLHTYCEFHRQRSIRNQQTFDRKRRARELSTEASDWVAPPVKTKPAVKEDSNTESGKPAKRAKSDASDGSEDRRYNISFINGSTVIV